MFRGSPLESKELRGTTKGLDIPCRGTPGHFRTSDGIVINYVRTVRSTVGYRHSFRVFLRLRLYKRRMCFRREFSLGKPLQ
jgi:hypothetical protein